MADFLCSEAIVRHVFKRVVPLRANPSTLELRLPIPVLQDPVAHGAHGARAWRIWCAWRNRTPPVSALGLARVDAAARLRR